MLLHAFKPLGPPRPSQPIPVFPQGTRCLICPGVQAWIQLRIRNKLKVKSLAWIRPLLSLWDYSLLRRVRHITACQGYLLLQYTSAFFLPHKDVLSPRIDSRGENINVYLNRRSCEPRISKNIGFNLRPPLSPWFTRLYTVYLTFSPLSSSEADCALQLTWQQTCHHSRRLEVNGNEPTSSVASTRWESRQQLNSL